MTRVSVVRQGFHAQQLQSQTVYAVQDAEEVRLVDDLAREDRIPAFRFHLHPFEGHGVRVAELATHDYAVEPPGAPAHHLFTADLHIFSVSKRSAQRAGSSSPTSAFPLGDLWVSV